MRNIRLFLFTACFYATGLSAQTLMHYWNFNSTTNLQAHLAPASSLVSGAAIDTLLYTGGSALVDVANGTGQGFDVNNLNARNGDAAGNHLRFNNPIYGALRFSLPSTGYQDLVVKYVSMRSGSGAYYQFVHYTTDGINYVLFDTIEPTTTPTLYTLDFSAVIAVNNNPDFKVRITFGQGGGGTAGNNRIDNFTMEGNPIVPLSLIHYWNFNSTASLAAHLTANTANVTGAAIDTFLFSGGSALVDVVNGTGQGFDVNNFNARNSDVAGNHLRFNNPIYGALRFSLPTTGYRDVVVKYASMRSGSGAYNQLVHYTTDGTNYQFFDTIKPGTAPALYTLDFSTITTADNNPDFKIRITFQQGGGGTAGNNRFDNVTLEGYSLTGSDLHKPSVLFAPLNNTADVAVNITPTITFSENVRLVNNTAIDNNNADTLVELRLNDSAGTQVPFDAVISGKVITITPGASLLNNQQYYIAVKAGVIEDLADNVLDSVKWAKFTTIVPQTVFSAGDLVPVAYRMNATNADDEVALLTLVDILPGTKVNVTDGKYTTNIPAQCPGGLVWTAPASGIAAGSVISIKNDAGTVNTGSLSGANFGLSSGGDQFIVYTGTHTSPVHVTALSSNNWLTANTTCSGSNSLRPASLTDGVSSIQLSTTKGAVSGNTANAYYNGPQTGSAAQLRSAILDTTNWVGSASGTAPQTWPAWNFPGPPAVVSASVVNATTIRIIFNEDLETASATNTANFTGIAGLASVTQSSNGALADTLLLNFSASFAGGSSNTLVISGVRDAGNVPMFAPYSFSFTYNTSISFDRSFISVKEDTGSVNLVLHLNNPSTSSVQLVVKGAPFSTASANDYTLATQVLNFTGASNATQIISIPINNDNVSEQDEYVVLSLESATGLSITGSPVLTVFIRDNDKQIPVAQKKVELKYVGSFDPGPLSGSTTEIVVYDSASRRLFMTSAIQDRLDIADFTRPDSIVLVKSVNMAPYGGITSVAVFNGLVAVASPNANEQLNGTVVFFNTNGDSLKRVTVGALPDMITFTPDGKKVMTANEGQPNDSYSIDPEGSVSVIDLTNGINNLTQAQVTTLDFTSFNAQETALRTQGVRKLKLSSTLSQDLEPEYITISADNKNAWVTLQENNAIASINLQTNTVESIWPLGMKNYNETQNAFDASDNSGFIHLSNYPVKAFYIPDGIAGYTAGGTQYLVTANEGDEKEYSGLNERTTVGAAGTILDSAIFPHRTMLKENHHIGRLRMTNLSGDSDGDGDYDEIHVVGSRSFTIWNAATKAKVYDSANDFELITSTDPSIAPLFNADNESNGTKSRSRAKGPEPEGLTIARIDNRQIAFIALERVGGVMVYDITDPANVVYQDYKNSRSLTSYSGDHGPEGITYISPLQSPDGKAYITVANELSGTISVYEVKNNMPRLAQFTQASAMIPEGSGAQQVQIRLDHPAVVPSSITVKVFRGSNVTVADYQTNPVFTGDSVVIPVVVNASAATFSFTPTDDMLDENNEVVTFMITRTSGNINVGPGNIMVFTVTDNDTTIPARVAGFAASNLQVNEDGGTVTATINLSAPLNGTGQLVLKANKGAGVTNADFTTTPGLALNDSLVITLANGVSTASFDVQVNNDTQDEAHETVVFEIVRAEGNMIIGQSASFMLTIADNDTTIPARSIGFSQMNQTTGEGAGTINVTLNLSAPSDGPGRVVLKAIKGLNLTNNDFTTTPALSPGDSVMIDFADGAVSASFGIQLNDDEEDENNETLSFSIVKVTGNVNIGISSFFTLTITDNDSLSSALDEITADDQAILIYPNPANGGKVFFSRSIDVELYDMQGKLIVTGLNRTELDVAGLSKGVYHIRINGRANRKLVVE